MQTHASDSTLRSVSQFGHYFTKMSKLGQVTQVPGWELARARAAVSWISFLDTAALLFSAGRLGPAGGSLPCVRLLPAAAPPMSPHITPAHSPLPTTQQHTTSLFPVLFSRVHMKPRLRIECDDESV